MEGIEILIYIAVGVTLFIVILSTVLQKLVPRKKSLGLRIAFLGLIFLSLGAFVLSLYLLGWEGIAYFFVSISILIGTILGGLIISLSKLFTRSMN
ncbi:hypothetical protein M3557_14540 [Bhargavaea ginsengi]|uniref:YesK family protein n=1 Tax=Bhargavaea ginsengi TaxID=426757 RepID=UPI00203E140B|nr:YesK family protein [Bhargavaea ginsengi]MCM3089135.1 hypothetical protein [Bhargavaea ginsengi]